MWPATAYIEWMTAAAGAVLGSERATIDDLVLSEPLIVPAEGCLLQVVVTPQGDGDAAVQVFSRVAATPGLWRRHAAGTLRGAGDAAPAPFAGGLEAAKRNCDQPLPVSAFYESLRDKGIEFGPAFRCVTDLWRGDGQSLGEVRRDAADGEAYTIHPALLDGCLQILAAALPGAANGAPDQAYLPFGADRVRVHRGSPAGERVWSHVRLRPAPAGAEGLSADVAGAQLMRARSWRRSKVSACSP